MADTEELPTNLGDGPGDKIPIKPEKTKAKASISKGFQKAVDDEFLKDEPNLSVVRQYLEFDVSLLSVDAETGVSILHRAAASGAADIVKKALSQKSEVDPRTAYGRTPLHNAAEKNLPEIMKILINHDADINAVSIGGMSALHLSVRQNAKEAVDTLLSTPGILLELENSERKNALSLCKNDEIRKLLEEAYASD